MIDPDVLRARFNGWPSLPAMFFDQAARSGGATLLQAKRDGQWRAWSWTETAGRVRAAARGLAALGVGRGDRVAIVAENRPEWLEADLATMALGAITVPAYTTSTTQDYVHLFGDSGARVVLVSTPALMRKVVPAALQLAGPVTLIGFDAVPQAGRPDVSVLGWDELLERGAADPAGTPDAADPAEAWRDLGRDDPACIIYTSGTGGAPKGVLLSHANVMANCRAALELILELGLEQERFLSFLPLSHAYEHSCGQFFALSLGAEIAYAESVDRLAANLTEMRPTIMTAVPRLYEVLQARIQRDMQKAGRLRRALFEKTLELGSRRYRQGGRLGPLDAVQDWALDRLVRSKARARFGGRLKAFVSGGAPLSPELGLFFHALGLRILQGYGQTEAAPLISVNRPSRIRHETVGPPVLGTEIRIAEDGEIQVRGPQIMLGYWNDEAATERAVEDGWLRTGDIGRVEDDGSLVITDRKKDLIVTSGGENVAPQRLENLLTLEPVIGQVMVSGDRRPYLVALVVPDRETALAWARRHDHPGDMAQLADDAEFRKVVGEAIERVNRGLAPLERIRRFAMLPEPFSVENGELTPTLKIRRHVIRQRYMDRLDALYG
ncbi:AMP-dependent synthetase/ligase [Arenibaculum pallidiluteum]|uniref:AMP-dependent synthetase/ligase n=1 Tax=Arenibaculum pallidiluteum TaxID=2812559 RepID=UPI001A95F8BB|nr:long-chain fatty acid--CoA ligase [Arenibaculum pallidiluteum]